MASAIASRFFLSSGVYPGWWVVVASGVIGPMGRCLLLWLYLFFNPREELI
jgi:hypothetical protein